MTIVCFFHQNDFDGICSAAIVKKAYPDAVCVGVSDHGAEHVRLENAYLTYKYNNETHNIYPTDTVIIVDFSFTDAQMIALDFYCDFIWIDHHKSAINKFGPAFNGKQVIGRAACELAWEYFFPEKSTPEAVWLLGVYDTWRHSSGETKYKNALPFQYGMRALPYTKMDSPIWNDLLADPDIHQYRTIEKIISDGKAAKAFVDKLNKSYAESMSFETDFHGHRALVMNKAFAGSRDFEGVYNPDKHDIVVLFSVKPGRKEKPWKYSLFCDKPGLDVSQIATQYGGGGHAGAAGFIHDRLLF